MSRQFHPLTFLRVTLLVLASYLAVFMLPASNDRASWQLVTATAVLFGLIIMTLIRQAMERRQQLLGAVRIELNKLRRVYHIAKNLSVVAPQRFRGWFTDVHGFLYEYLNTFAGKNFADYDSANAAFRKLSYHIYTIPELETKKEEALFDDLLHTTGVVAEARQHIKELSENRLPLYGWLVTSIMLGGFIASVLVTLGANQYDRFVSGTLLVCATFSVDILCRIDSLRAERKMLSKRYVDNVARLELSRK